MNTSFDPTRYQSHNASIDFDMGEISTDNDVSEFMSKIRIALGDQGSINLQYSIVLAELLHSEGRVTRTIGWSDRLSEAYKKRWLFRDDDLWSSTTRT